MLKLFDWREIFTAGMILFAVIDIVGSIPIVIDLKKKVGRIQSEKASLIAGVIMIAFLFVGKEILNLIGIDVNSFAVAGAFILFFLALEMILGISLYKDDAPETASVVPLAFPLIAGAGTMTSILSLRAEYETVNIIVAIVINIIFGEPGYQCSPKDLRGNFTGNSRKIICNKYSEFIYMKYFIYTVIFLAVVIIGVNFSLLDFDNLMDGDSGKAMIFSVISLCVIVLMGILLISRSIAKKQE